MSNSMATQNSEEHRIQLLQLGNKKAFETIYDKYAPMLYSVILRLLEDAKIADKILQQSILKIWKNKLSFNSAQEHIFTWMMKFARSNSLHFRSILSKNGSVENQKDVSFVYKIKPEDEVKKQKTDSLEQKALRIIYIEGCSLQKTGKELCLNHELLKQNLKKAINGLKVIPEV